MTSFICKFLFFFSSTREKLYAFFPHTNFLNKHSCTHKTNGNLGLSHYRWPLCRCWEIRGEGVVTIELQWFQTEAAFTLALKQHSCFPLWSVLYVDQWSTVTTYFYFVTLLSTFFKYLYHTYLLNVYLNVYYI